MQAGPSGDCSARQLDDLTLPDIRHISTEHGHAFLHVVQWQTRELMMLTWWIHHEQSWKSLKIKFQTRFWGGVWTPDPSHCWVGTPRLTSKWSAALTTTPTWPVTIIIIMPYHVRPMNIPCFIILGDQIRFCGVQCGGCRLPLWLRTNCWWHDIDDT